MTAPYMPPMCQTYGPDLGAELQHAVEARLSDLGIPNPTEADIARAIAHEESTPMKSTRIMPPAGPANGCPTRAVDAPLFGPPVPYQPGDELQADQVLAILGLGSCACGAVIVDRESIKQYGTAVTHYCVPTRSLTR